MRLTYPWFGTQRDALAFLTQRREWVERVRAKRPPNGSFPRDEATRRARIEAAARGQRGAARAGRQP